MLWRVSSAGVPLVDRVIVLARALAARGFDVAPSDTLDAAAALTHLDLGAPHGRSDLRACLRAALVKQPDPDGAFDRLFDRCFPAAPRSAAAGTGDTGDSRVADPVATLAGGDLGEFAAGLVDTHAGIGAGEARGEKHYVQRVLRAADLARLMMLALRDDTVDAAQLRHRVDELKALIADEVAARLTDEDRSAPPDDVAQLAFLNASRAELEQMRAAVRPLARRVATKLAQRRRRAASGRIDMRRTLRRSLASGGVPLDVAQRQRRTQRPELYVLCDISGSVAEFSVFTLTLMAALSAELPRTRSFVFVDDVDEVTDVLERTGHAIEPWQLLRNTNVIGTTGHSDYAEVFSRFQARVGSELSRAATVLVTGDGRSNYRPDGAPVFGELARRCRSVFWLNPEPRAEWFTHDSAIAAYGPHCTAMFEVCTLRQLESAIERIL